ncbi:MAG TPA: hypothetical protein VET85_04150 [Stellaceae bacterium]|nr:hypothetical protein [Stellaceae bacterium]
MTMRAISSAKSLWRPALCRRVALLAVGTLGLAGCVYAPPVAYGPPPGPYAYAPAPAYYYPGPAYYGPPVVGGFFFGGRGHFR